MEETPQPQGPDQKRDAPSTWGWGCAWAFAIAVVLYFVFGVCFGPIVGNHRSPFFYFVQTSHAVGMAFYAYANDHGGLYPDGKSSTEVFQQLMDGGYISDPGFFYVEMDGKTKAAPDQKILKPENVCWDVTGGASNSDPGELPLLFLTGYRFTYAAGGGFTPLQPFPPYKYISSDSGLSIFFINNSSCWKVPKGEPAMEHILPTNFDPHGKTYRQLTPDGVLR